MTAGGDEWDIERVRRALNHPDPREIHDRADFARKLTEAKDRAGLTVRDIASGTGIAPATVGDYCAGRHVPSARQADTLVAILAYCGITQPEEQAEWLAALSRVRRTRARQRGEVEPYRGLAPFTAGDAEWFFGRDELVAELVGQVTAQPPGAPPILVIGSSGSGKSSLLHAGLVPAVARRGDHWLSMTPGAHPLRSLTECLADRPGGRLLLVVDQFEEVFTACDDAAERVEFLDLLLERRPDTQVVLGMRADCYERAARYPGLIPVLRNQPFVVGPMTEAQLRECIVAPAAKARVELESGLVEILLRDLAPTVADVGSLPLLSHALLAMWQRQERGRMTVDAYRTGGGIQEAVARSAESVYAGLSAAQAALARHIFVRLVRLEPNTADSRVKVAPAELLPHDVTAAEFTSVLDLLVEHRLVTSDVDGLQIVHEALIHAWPRLRGWLDADRADARTRRQLADAARTWDDSGRDPSGLWGGLLLDTVLVWPTDHGLNQLESEFLRRSADRRAEQMRAERRGVRRLRRLVAGLVALVLVSCGLAGYTVAQNKAATRQRDLAESRLVAGEAERLRGTDPGPAAQLAVAATRIAVTPEARAAVLESTAAPLPARLLGPPGVLQALAAAPGGELLAGATNNEIRLWHTHDRRHPTLAGAPLYGPAGTVFALAFSADGSLLAVGGGDHRVYLWDVRRPADPVRAGPPLAGPANTVYSVAFSPDGHTLAAGSADRAVHRWNVTDPATPVALPTLTGPAGAVHAVAFSGDGRSLAAGSADGTVWLWPASGRGRAVVLDGPGGIVYTVAFAPDSATVAAGSGDHYVYLWHVADPARSARLAGAANWVNAVAFAPDGHTLAAGSSDNTVRVWDLRSDRMTEVLPHAGPVTAVDYLSGAALASASADGVVDIWPLPGPDITAPKDGVFTVDYSRDGRLAAIAPAKGDDTASLWWVSAPGGPVLAGPPVRPPAPSRFDGSAALTPDGHLLAVGSDDGTVRLWDVTDPARPMPVGPVLTGATTLVESLSVSPNGTVLAAATDDHTVLLWDISDPSRPRPLPTLTGAENYVYSAAFSPDGRTLAAASADHTVRLWDIRDPDRPRPLVTLRGPTNYVYSVAFSPDGHTLAAGGEDHLVWLWDVRTPARPVRLGRPLVGPANFVYSVAFSPDGRTLAGGSGDGTVWLWDVGDPARPAPLGTLTASAESVFTVSFSPDGRQLAEGGADGVVRFYATGLADAARRICAGAGDGLTRAEWRQYVPGVPFDPPCAADGH